MESGLLSTSGARPRPPTRRSIPIRRSSKRSLRPGDVLLVDSAENVSNVVKYLTQSTWSHAAFYIGDALGPPPPGEEPKVLIEADMRAGVRAVPLSHFARPAHAHLPPGGPRPRT